MPLRLSPNVSFSPFRHPLQLPPSTTCHSYQVYYMQLHVPSPPPLCLPCPVLLSNTRSLWSQFRPKEKQHALEVLLSLLTERNPPDRHSLLSAVSSILTNALATACHIWRCCNNVQPNVTNEVIPPGGRCSLTVALKHGVKQDYRITQLIERAHTRPQTQHTVSDSSSVQCSCVYIGISLCIEEVLRKCEVNERHNTRFRAAAGSYVLY